MQNQIPKNWKKVKLGNIANVISGFAFKSADFTSKGIPVIKIKNIASGSLTLDNLDYFDGEINGLEKYKIKKGDILISMTGSHVSQWTSVVGKITRNNRDQIFLMNQRVGKIQPDTTKVNNDFFYYILHNDEITLNLANRAGGSANQANISPEIIKSLEIYIPGLEDQKKIASIISTFDDKIELNNKIAKTLEEIAQALFKEWFALPSVALAKEGELTTGWKVGKLSDIATIIMGQSPASEFYNQKGEGFPFHQGVTNFRNRFPNHEIYCTQNNRVAEKGDILFSVRAPVGRLNIADTKTSLGRGVASVRHKKGYQSYLYYLLKRLFKKEDSLGGGSIFPSVTKDDMEAMKILVPDERVVKEFEEIVSGIDKKIESIEKENQKLAALRDLLLPKLMKGEIRV